MNLKATVEVYKKCIERKFTMEECIAIMGPLGIDPKGIASIVDLICSQPERSKRENAERRCGALNTIEIW